MLNLLDRIGGAMFAAAWPLSTIGLYGTGDTLFPDQAFDSSWLELVVVIWFFALPYAVSLYLASDD